MRASEPESVAIELEDFALRVRSGDEIKKATLIHNERERSDEMIVKLAPRRPKLRSVQ